MPMRLRKMMDPIGRGTSAAIVTLAAALSLAGASRSTEEPREAKPTSVGAAHIASPAEVRLREDVTYLASDAREGRGPGTRGIEEASDYIAFVFRSAGLRPAPGADGYFQNFTIGGSPTLDPGQGLAFRGPSDRRIEGKFASDFTPLAIGIARVLEHVPVVFAGYGITAKDDEHKLDYDDYAGIDVKGKAVLILRREPQDDDEDSPFDGRHTTRYATFQHKATNAYQHGAAAVLLVNDRLGVKDGKDELLKFMDAGRQPFSRLPFVMLTREFADRMLAAAHQPSLGTLEHEIDAELKPHSREIGDWTLDGRVAITDETRTRNVIGMLEGAGPHADETVIIGAHYDHLGRGGLFSGSLAPLSHDIHNGADDNASGTSMVLELARRLGARRDPPPRRIVFMAFSGEERGLLGSAYYVRHPLYPLASTVAMFNCDMVGRLNEKDELTMIGTGTSPGFEELVDVLGRSSGLKIKKVAGMTDGFGGSDHQSFYRHDIPVLFAFTGVHKDYHRPTDDSDRINYAGMARIADYLELLMLDVVRRPERPAFTHVAERREPGAKDPAAARMGGVYLGTMPDYAETKEAGMKLQGVSEGSPAEKAGLKGGDVIIRFGDKKVGTIYDYMEALGGHKPGDEVEVTVKRDGKEVKLRVTLGSRSKG